MSSVKEIRSVRNACALVERIAAEQPIGVSELARRTGLDKSTAYRLVTTLEQAGWLRRDTGGRWMVAPALSALVTPASGDALVELVRPLVGELRDVTGETAMLVSVERGRLLVRDVADSPHALRITAPVGSELPIRDSSALRAIAAHLDAGEVDELRLLDPGLDDATLEETRRRGWAVNDRRISADTRVVGAAILTAARRPLGALIVCAPTSRVDLRAMHRLGERVADAASRAGRLLGAPGAELTAGVRDSR